MPMGMFLYFIQTQHVYFKQAKRILINLPTLKKILTVQPQNLETL